MIFKDRADAGNQLTNAVLADQTLQDVFKQKNKACVVSLLRGGFIVGKVIAKQLKIPHLPLVAVKIPAPDQPELAIGALCFNSVYFEESIIRSLQLSHKAVLQQKNQAQDKFDDCVKKFRIKKGVFNKRLNKVVFLVDDGIATGSTIEAARRFLETKKPARIVLTAPTAPAEFNSHRFNTSIILDRNSSRLSVSQAYENFPQIEDDEIKAIL